MTAAPMDISIFRTNKVIPLTGLAGNAVGIAPDSDHLRKGGYHVGCMDIKAIQKWLTDYSVRQKRDQLDGTNYSSAMDIGDDWPNGGRKAWLRYNRLLVELMMAGDPALAALRAVNFSPDGVACKRYDSLHPEAGIIPSTDTVYMHTHHEWWRDTINTVSRALSFIRIGQIIQAAINNTPVPEFGEDEETMGASYPPLTINKYDATAEDLGGTSLSVAPANSGAADKRQVWISFCNDTYGKKYALRVVITKGDGSWAPLPSCSEVLVLDSGKRFGGILLPDGTASVSISRWAVNADGKAVKPSETSKPYGGDLKVTLERGPVQH